MWLHIEQTSIWVGMAPNLILRCSYLLLSISNGCEPVNRLWTCDLTKLPTDSSRGSLDLKDFDVAEGKHRLPLTKFIDNFDASYSYVANNGSEFFLHTNLLAPRYR